MERKQKIEENLQDAGCEKETINKFFELLEQNKKDEIYILLYKYRKKLLEKIHKTEKNIDILDYLITTLKKEN